jgi:hypothetical protein
MSRSVDLFVGTDLPLHQLAIEMGSHIGCRLVADAEKPQWTLREGDVAATLAEHPYANDTNLPLTRYRYALSARVANTARPGDTPEAAMLRRVAHKIQQGPGWPVLLVLDLQYRDGTSTSEAETAGSGGAVALADRVPPDIGPPDTGSPDTGSPVTGSPVTGSPVTGSPVTGSPVTGSPVTGSPDTGPPAPAQTSTGAP